jgi:hypothetical protein
LIRCVNWIGQQSHFLQNWRQTSSPHLTEQGSVGYSLQAMFHFVRIKYLICAPGKQNKWTKITSPAITS